MVKLNIGWIKRYSRLSMASSRIRAHALHQAICENDQLSNKYTSQIYYFKAKRPINIDKKTDVLIVQKRTDKNILDFIKNEFKGKMVIYDYDDFIYGNSCFVDIANSVNIVTTDTKYNKKFFEEQGFKPKCYVLEDCIDYFPTKMEKPNKNNQTLCWFSQSRYFKRIRWQLKYLSNTDYTTNIITGRHLREKDTRLEGLSNLNVIRWDLKTFTQNLRKASVSLLSHHKRKKSIGKSNNRMLVSITNGVPAIVGNSIEYEKLAKQFNLDYSIANNEDEFKNALDYLKHYKNRKKYLKDIQPYIWEKYNSTTIATKLTKIIEKNI